MILWRRMIGVSLGAVAASGLWTVAQTYPAQAEGLDRPLVIQVDPAPETLIPEALTPETLTPETPIAETPTDSKKVTIAAKDLADLTDLTAVQVALVPTEVLANLSSGQIEAIATIVATVEETTGAPLLANLPPEVLTPLNPLPTVGQAVGRRRWLPTNLVRRLRLPQVVTSLIRQPKNTALVMLGNHIVVVNPVTGAILGAVLSAL
jgi:hypothetical protein